MRLAARAVPDPARLTMARSIPTASLLGSAVACTPRGAVLLASGASGWCCTTRRSARCLPQPLEAWTMRLHGLAAFVALFMLGVLAAAPFRTAGT